MSDGNQTQSRTKLRLGNVSAKIGSGATPRGGNSVYQNEGTTFIRSQNVLNDRFNRNGLAFIADDHAELLIGVTVNAGDVLLNITGDSVARVCQAPPDILPARVNQHVAIIRPNPEELDARYLRYYLVNPSMQQELLAMAGAGATRNALTKGMIENLEINAPTSVDDQRAIAHILGTLDDKIELNRRMNETLEAMARAIFKSWFVDFDPVRAKASDEPPDSICRRLGLTPDLLALFPDSFQDSELGDIPAGWVASTLGEHVEIHDSKRVPLSNREREDRQGPFPYYGAAALMDHVDGYLFDGVHILMGEDGSVTNPNGTPVLQYVWGRFWVNNHAHVLTAKSPMTNEHLLLLVRDINIAAFVTGAVQAKLSQGNLRRIPVIKSPAKLNELFGERIAPLFSAIREIDEQQRTLSEIRDALLPRLLTGELPVDVGIPA